MQLCIALDRELKEENLALLRNLERKDVWVKVGLKSFIRDGWSLLESIKGIGEFKIFLDLKLYDIPNTMAEASKEIAKLPVDMFTLHLSSGEAALKASVQSAREVNENIMPVGVSVLTSFDDMTYRKIYNASIDESFGGFIDIASSAGLSGMVSSVFESKRIKEQNPKLITVTPGIRPYGESSGDQKRVADLGSAKENLSDMVVIGRPIYGAEDPSEVVERILSDMLQ